MRKAMPEHPERILLLMCNWLGDTFWAMQIIPDLKKRFPNAEIHVGIKEFSRELFFKQLPENQILTFAFLTSDRTREKFSLRGYLKDLFSARRLKPELVIDTMGNRYSALFAYFSGADFTIGPDPADELAALYSMKISLAGMPDHHLIYKPAVIASCLTGYDSRSAIVPFPVQARVSKKELFQQLNWTDPEARPIALLVPGAGWMRKQWPAASFRELAETLERRGFRIVLSGAANEKELCAYVASNLHGAVILPPQLSLVISLLPYCSVVISNDSGVAHLAAAEGAKVISLFCCTNPEFCRPLGENVHILKSTCPEFPVGSIHSCDECRHPEFHMNISVDEVLKLMEPHSTTP